MSLCRIAVFYLCFTFIVYAQETELILQVKVAFEDFEYSRVIQLSDSLLHTNLQFTSSQKNELLLMKAISHYALSEESQSRKCFIDMLGNDRGVQLDSYAVSPKILSLFLLVREEFLEFIPKQDSKVNGADKKDISEAGMNRAFQQYTLYHSSLYKSLILPGWGHYTLGEKTKGIVLGSAYLISIGTAVYYIAESSKRETEYLSSVEASEIQSRYASYNSEYKFRNAFIAGLAALWLYAQGDLLFSGTKYTGGISYIPTGYSGDSWGKFALKFRISLF